jgi:hypothetical protein
MSALSLEVLAIFIILKVDGFSELTRLDWVTLIVLPFVIGAAFVIVWMIVHFYSVGAENVNKAILLNPQEVLMDPDIISVHSIEDYNEFHVFRDILLFAMYCFFIVYGVAIYVTPCRNCNTPYDMLSLGIIITYSIRTLVLIYHFQFYVRRYNLMSREISNYRTLMDEDRLFKDSLPDLHASDEYSYSYLLDSAMFMATLALAMLGTVWVANNECAIRCVKLFHYSKYLLGGMYILEAFYLISVLLLRFHFRMSGVETIQTLFSRIKTQNAGTINIKKPYK